MTDSDDRAKPLVRYILNGAGSWCAVASDGKIYPKHTHTAEAMLKGLKPGAVVEIYAPGDLLDQCGCGLNIDHEGFCAGERPHWVRKFSRQ
jgi:hypothetical protein